MDLELTKLALSSGDLARAGAVARDLGRHLAARSEGGWLLPFRRLVARLGPSRTSEYERGFLEALELVATGFERQIDDAAADETEVLQLRSRPNWIAALRHISQGTVRPIDLARRLDVSPSRITKLVDELEEARLVTQMMEGKERPCRLTPRARVLLGKLPPPDGDDALVAKAVAEVVPAVVSCMGALARDRRVGRARLLETMGSALTVSRSTILALLDTALRDTSWAVLDKDDAWVATDAELLTRLQQHLALACQGRRGPIFERLAKLSERSDVVLRVGGSFLEWDTAVSELTRIHVLREGDLRYAEPRSLSGEVQVVYESPSLLAADRRHRWMEQVIDRAIGRYVLGVANGPRSRTSSRSRWACPSTRRDGSSVVVISTSEQAARLVTVDVNDAIRGKILQVLARSRALLAGHFALHRGRHATSALRFRGIGRDPAFVGEVVDALVAKLPAEVQRELPSAKLLTPASAGFFLGRALATRYGRPLVVAQTDLRRLPAKTLRSGVIQPNDRVVLVNDVASTGTSLDALRELVVERGGRVVAVVLFGVVDSPAVTAYCARWQLPSHWLVTARWETYAPEVCPGCQAGEPLVSVAELA
jgi:orotate phosphoribosyltransferase